MKFQEVLEAKTVLNLLSTAKVDIAVTEEGLMGQLDGLRKALTFSSGVLQAGRVIVVEQVLSLALRLQPSELEKAKRLVRDQISTVAGQQDNVDSDMIQQQLWQSAQNLLG